MIPIGIVHTSEIRRAITRAHHERCVGQAQTVAKLMPTIMRKNAAYQDQGTGLYLRIIFVWLSSSAPRTARVWIQISSPWKRIVWKITAAIAAKESPYVKENVVERNKGE